MVANVTRVTQTAAIGKIGLTRCNMTVVYENPDQDADFGFLGWKFGLGQNSMKTTLSFTGLPTGLNPSIVVFANFAFSVRERCSIWRRFIVTNKQKTLTDSSFLVSR
jgi:hypothetical protein